METVISKDGTIIAFDQSGEGRPVIMADGALVAMPNAAFWKANTTMLRRKYWLPCWLRSSIPSEKK